MWHTGQRILSNQWETVQRTCKQPTQDKGQRTFTQPIWDTGQRICKVY